MATVTTIYPTTSAAVTTIDTNIQPIGTIASQNANDVEITGGTITGLSTPLAITSGGTGAATVSAALLALGLDQVDNTSDADKPISDATQAALDLKLSISDTTSFGRSIINAADAAAVLALLTASLPTSLPGTSGVVWNNGGVLSIS